MMPEESTRSTAGFVSSSEAASRMRGKAEYGHWLIEVVEMDRLRIASIQLTDREVAQ
ncbi:MAG: hypothetical protein R2706_20030 [Acidimicrobiales bacterium]